MSPMLVTLKAGEVDNERRLFSFLWSFVTLGRTALFALALSLRTLSGREKWLLIDYCATILLFFCHVLGVSAMLSFNILEWEH